MTNAMRHRSKDRRGRDRRINTHTMIAELEQHLRTLRIALGHVLRGQVIEGHSQQDIEESITEGNATLDYLRTRV